MRIASSVPPEALRLAATSIARALDVANREMSTGRHADLGLALGAQLGRPVEARVERVRLDAFESSDALVNTRLSATQASLGGLRAGADSLREALIAAKAAPQQRAGLVDVARAFLNDIVATMGRDVAGAALFGGRNLQAPILADYDPTRATGPAATLQAAFVGAFGFDQDDAAVSTITAPALNAFLAGSFDALFQPAGWSADWSSATDATTTVEIAPGRAIANSLSANDPSFALMTKAVTMVADLGAEKLSGQAFEALADAALQAISRASAGIEAIEAQVGVAQNQMAKAQEAMRTLRASLDLQIGADEGVDAFEAATRVNELRTRLETTYALTARLRGLSLLNYL